MKLLCIKRLVIFSFVFVFFAICFCLFFKIKEPLNQWAKEKKRQHLTTNFHIVKGHQIPKTNGIPRIYIETKNARFPFTKGIKQKATYMMQDEDGNITNEGKVNIKGRGNSTWNMPKKPYSLNFKEETGFFDFPPGKKFALLNSYPDKTFLRTVFSLHIAKDIYKNLEWTPLACNIEVVINGLYLGIYQFSQRRTIEKNRLNLPLKSYLLEIDRPEENVMITPSKMKVNVKSPQLLTSKEFSFIKQKVFALDHAIWQMNKTNEEETGFCQGLLDLPSTVDWYLVNEFTKNHDAFFRASVYFYWNSEKQKFFFGPAWDFDLSCGNYDHDDCQYPQGLHITNKWAYFWLGNDTFKKAVKNRWNQTKDQLLYQITHYIDSISSSLQDAQKWNFLVWDILQENVWPNYVVNDTYQKEVEYMKDFLLQRYQWLDEKFNEW